MSSDQHSGPGKRKRTADPLEGARATEEESQLVLKAISAFIKETSSQSSDGERSPPSFVAGVNAVRRRLTSSLTAHQAAVSASAAGPRPSSIFAVVAVADSQPMLLTSHLLELTSGPGAPPLLFIRGREGDGSLQLGKALGLKVALAAAFFVSVSKDQEDANRGVVAGVGVAEAIVREGVRVVRPPLPPAQAELLRLVAAGQQDRNDAPAAIIVVRKQQQQRPLARTLRG